jgi:L-iditol 2-dehydrogenase
MPVTMHYAELAAPGEVRMSVAEVPDPGPGELLIEVRAALTCGTDLKAFRRGHPMIPMPGPMGHEFSGVVAARGAGVRRFRAGDEIMSVHTAPCLTCRYCDRKLHHLCEDIMQTKVMGAFGQYVLLPAHIVRQNVYKKPRHLSFAEAALLEPLACVVHGVEPLGNLRDVTVLVIGAGPIGLLHVMLLEARGASVVAADQSRERLITAKEAGAEMTVLPDQIALALDKATAGLGFDVVIECTGRPEVWEQSVSYLRRGGTAVLFGGCPSGTRACFETHRLHYDEITVRGDFHFTPADVKKAYTILTKGQIRTDIMISGEFPLDRLAEAFALLSEGTGIKYALIPPKV